MGGMGTIIGPVVGGVIMVILPEALRGLGNWRMVIYGIMLLITIIKFPGGMTPYLVRFFKAIGNIINRNKISDEG